MMQDISICRNLLLNQLLKDKEELLEKKKTYLMGSDQYAIAAQLGYITILIVKVQQGEFQPKPAGPVDST